ncbi:high affinity immunoglobulin gamma Fc receptor I [Astyanax mexicanus]|uniref:high affinity immunoglobulin gamma Fc receptor I n=1 Tax=Astyanax mexicanus TaxID=7994 RepID=UPI0020CB40A0|nr:high affinity immunoglobulin gamma Fc receptor I [Astyanax mexicanus]
MDFLPGSVAVLALFAIVKSQDPTPLPVLAKITVQTGEARLFSEEDVQLKCSIPDDPGANWKYHWFQYGKRLKTTEVYSFKNAAVQQSGNYTCQGEKDIEAWPYSLNSLPSEPITVHVDGGWALLRVPAEPVLIEESMTLTCRVRDEPVLVDVIFYKDDVEIYKSKSKDLVFKSLTLKDQGFYSCRATWTQRFEFHSAQSQPAFVTVLDKLVTPVLKLEPKKSSVKRGDNVVLRCVTQLNAREKGHSIDYYFFKDEERLGPSSSHEAYTIQRAEENDAGFYTCKVRVRTLHLEKWSDQVELRVRK